ncbi:MAG: PIG-L family deacetylase [Armatimonadetes bacterium]|nr:PIG-L family deacetylase [Armatimonadota bacterium]MDW8028677.1 PIG-L family deacetylase [Armatimonadota bacterium]
MKVTWKRRKRKTRQPIFLSKRLVKKRKVWRGIFWFALLSVAALPSIHWANRMIYRKQLQIAEPLLKPLPLTSLGERVVILSPHPDDETLGCAGLIQRLLESGIFPFLIMVTNGDGFDASIHLKLHEIQIKPKDREVYALMRRRETITAMQILGLPPSQIEFLDFSERTIVSDWLLEGDEKFVDAIAERLAKIKPTAVVLPSRYDDHPVHAVTCSLVWAALFNLVSEKRIEQMPLVLEFLIHYGEFPRPQGFHPSLNLLPPSELLLTARWYQVSLSPKMRQKKWEALKAYGTQKLPLTWRFLKSFVRENEIFAEPFFSPTQVDRTGEPRSILASLDISQVIVSSPQQNFSQASKSQNWVTVKLRGKANPRFLYGIRVWQPNGSQLITGTNLNASDGTITVRLPKSFETPFVITAFTGYGHHILDVTPMILEGVRR